MGGRAGGRAAGWAGGWVGRRCPYESLVSAGPCWAPRSHGLPNQWRPGPPAPSTSARQHPAPPPAAAAAVVLRCCMGAWGPGDFRGALLGPCMSPT